MAANKHKWHFIQTGGLMQVKLSTADDILNLRDLDQKLWIALSCPVKGLEFSEETLTLLDTDKNGRVRVPEILEAVELVKKYFKKPEIIMTEGDTIPLDALGGEPFSCGHSPIESAKSVLHILGKDDAEEISLDDISVNDKLFSPSVINGDGVLPPQAVNDETVAGVIRDIISCTGGADDISGVKGITREQAENFFKDLKAIKEWKKSVRTDAQDIFFLNIKTDTAASSYMKLREKIDEFFLRCTIDLYSNDVSSILKKKEEDVISQAEILSENLLENLPLANPDPDQMLSFGPGINPAWKDDVDAFVNNVVVPIFGEGKMRLSETDWKKIQKDFEPYMAWYSARPDNTVSSIEMGRIDEILASDAEQIILAKIPAEEKHPPIALATLDLRKMILYRRDLVELLKNFVSFENFYSLKDISVFQCGTLFIDGRSCDLCFRVLDPAKHATMSPLSQCYLLYCDCTRPSENRTMQIAAMVSAGNRENLLVGRNGLFYDREGNDWDATITKIVENPISIKEAFWSPYKKLVRIIQERLAKTASDAENSITSKMTSVVNNPQEKKFDVGTIAAISVACTGLATVVGGLLSAFFGLGYWIPLGVLGIILAISLPSMFIAWSKLRQRNIAPILDASGWAVNGNVKINIPLGAYLTHIGVPPKGSKYTMRDPFKQKKFPIKTIIFVAILIARVAWGVVSVIKNPNGVNGVLSELKEFWTGLVSKFKPA